MNSTRNTVFSSDTLHEAKRLLSCKERIEKPLPALVSDSLYLITQFNVILKVLELLLKSVGLGLTLVL